MNHIMIQIRQAAGLEHYTSIYPVRPWRQVSKGGRHIELLHRKKIRLQGIYTLVGLSAASTAAYGLH